MIVRTSEIPKRLPRRSSFAVALGDAERRLAAAEKMKLDAEKTVQAMHGEIPRLQAIIRALGGTVPYDFSQGETGKYVGKIASVPGVREIPEGAGSIPATSPDAEPVQQQAPDVTTLPGMEEEFQ